MRLESSNDMGDPREISCSKGTMELKEQTQAQIRKGRHMQHKIKPPDGSPCDHFGGHGGDQMPQMPQEPRIES